MLPPDASALTVEWVSAALSMDVPRVDVETRYIGFIGETVRLNLGERSVIAKFPTQNRQRRDYFAAMGMYEREVRFYEQIAPRIAVRTPACYFSAFDDSSGLGVLLLEDLAPARSGNRLKGCTIDEAERAIRAITHLHTAWWGSPEIGGMDWLHRYDPKSLQARFLELWGTFKTLDYVPASVLAIGEQLTKNIARLDVLWEPPLTLIHRDYQLDNLFFLDDQTAIIDWQLIAPGRGVFDVAMFLCWNTPPEFRRQHEMIILQMYHSLLLESGIKDYTFDQCQRDYRLSMRQCLLRLVPMLGSGLVEEAHLLATLQTLLERTAAALNDLDWE